ncbi:taste receptor type 2 member 42-like [Hippopotamus amphibius kiboko]|uniref:taste receptor type 2 member 42-like n=1 Tax=Hippopotamus amphibius kiboko TaxID=575201 RepID=UPI0025932549|nr:taste receptor type 2 member 42-like [Hippopotamus amphibius kiboko]
MVFLMLSVVGFTVGILGNVFIGLVLCSEWVKKHKISLVDFILISLAISRISQLLVFLFESIIIGLYPQLLATYKLTKLISFLWRITNHLTTWLATCLSILYLLKIAQLSHSLFLWLKWRMNRVIIVMLVFSLVFLVFDFLLLETLHNLFWNIVNESNLTLYLGESKTLYVKSESLLSLSYFIPIALSLLSLLCLFLSLVKHTRNLHLNFVVSRDFSTEAHKKAMKMVMSFLFLVVVHFFSTQLASWMFLLFFDHKFEKFIVLAAYVFPSGHSFILILGNNKLREQALKVLRHLKSSLKRQNPFTDALSRVFSKMKT